MTNRQKKTVPGNRPRRGLPAETRKRLVAAAGDIFNRVGYHGTDSNRIAKEAGYATGTFYKHFDDKREVFLAVYESWLRSLWSVVEKELAAGRKPEETARRLIELTIRFYTRWRGLRASLMELVFADAEVRRFYQAQRRRQLDRIAQLDDRSAVSAGLREGYAIYIFTTERVCDAIALGELQALGLDRDIIVGAMVEKLIAFWV